MKHESDLSITETLMKKAIKISNVYDHTINMTKKFMFMEHQRTPSHITTFICNVRPLQSPRFFLIFRLVSLFLSFLVSAA